MSTFNSLTGICSLVRRHLRGICREAFNSLTGICAIRAANQRPPEWWLSIPLRVFVVNIKVNGSTFTMLSIPLRVFANDSQRYVDPQLKLSIPLRVFDLRGDRDKEVRDSAFNSLTGIWFCPGDWLVDFLNALALSIPLRVFVLEVRERLAYQSIDFQFPYGYLRRGVS